MRLGASVFLAQPQPKGFLGVWVLWVATGGTIEVSATGQTPLQKDVQRAMKSRGFLFRPAQNCGTPLVPCDELDSETQGCEALEGGQR